MNQYTVDSFVLLKSKFVPLSQLENKLDDDKYIEGKIELMIDGANILTEDHWDLVDQLWAYLVDGVSSVVLDNKSVECFFPDQPLRLALKSLGVSSIEVTIGDDVTRVNKTSFVMAIGKGGKAFFEKMLQIVPSGKFTWMAYLSKCARLIEMAAA
ncbi:MAG: hypothetical protein AABP62_04700 [Planctomycetota bacterium]